MDNFNLPENIDVEKKERINYELEGATVVVYREFMQTGTMILQQLITLLLDMMEESKKAEIEIENNDE